MTTRFFAYIHSIVGESVMIQPQQGSPIIERGSLQDFQSMIPVNEPFKFCFHVKPDRTGIYDAWLNPPSQSERPVRRPAPKMPQSEDFNNPGGALDPTQAELDRVTSAIFQDKPTS